uniref:Uncharacterized protein n=1 Tax=Ditylenchus dipsaci TaxID=166011 RepID=A0A915DYN2_9BILA
MLCATSEKFCKVVHIGESFVCAFHSPSFGQMWNRIRNPPFAMSDPRTYQPRFVYAGSQYQLGAETYFVLFLYAAISSGIILINYAADIKKNPAKMRSKLCYDLFYFALYEQKILFFEYSLIGIGLVLVFFSLLMSVFRLKQRSYPFRLLFA